jgi:predicted RNase H-like HicB family nuclease
MELCMTSYLAVIDGELGAYGAWFPDLPGCVAMGETSDSLIRNAADALRDWAEVVVERGGRIPEPSALEALRSKPEVAEALAEGGLLRSVPLVRTSGKPRKANLSLDSGVLEAIDAEAARRGLTRSAFVEFLARHALADVAL